MKTVCKKLLCLMLVAMMLVSAVPFAFATEGEAASAQYWIEVRVNGEGKASKQFTMPENPTEEDVIAYAMADAEYSAYFADYANYAVAELGAIGAAINFTGEPAATEPPATEPPVTEAPETEATITFINKYAEPNKMYTRDYANGEEVEDLPAGVNVKGHDFKGWYSEENGKGAKLANGDTWYDGMADTYYAYYVESVNDDISTLSVYVRFYVAGVQQGNTQLLYKQDFEDGDNMFKWLQNHETKTSDAIFALEGSDGYQWEPRYYYNYSGNEPLTAQDLIANGDKSIVVKVYSKAATEANVMLYIHKSKTSTVSAIYEMPGYTEGNTVTYASVKEFLKKHYSGTLNLTGLYSADAWAQLLNGENPTAANGIKVEHNGTTKIHVILTNATSKSDSSNPKTGDYINVAATTMILAAAALVTVVELKKRKMI